MLLVPHGHSIYNFVLFDACPIPTRTDLGARELLSIGRPK
jgi:hypothetical protein